MTTSQNSEIPSDPLVLREQATAYFRQRQFEDAANVYDDIIERFGSQVAESFIRTLRCNIAACRIEQARFAEAITQLDTLFRSLEGTQGSAVDSEEPLEEHNILQKARLRRARCFFEVGRNQLALHDLDQYHARSKGHIDPRESALRNKIERALGKPEPFTEGIPFSYEIRVQGGTAAPVDVILINECAPAELFTSQPPREAGIAFLGKLVNKYDMYVRQWKLGGWMCWACKKPAASITHTPTMYLHLSQAKGGPKVIDLSQPVCETRGQCDMEARTFMQEEMTKSS